GFAARPGGEGPFEQRREFTPEPLHRHESRPGQLPSLPSRWHETEHDPPPSLALETHVEPPNVSPLSMRIGCKGYAKRGKRVRGGATPCDRLNAGEREIGLDWGEKTSAVSARRQPGCASSA